MTKKELIESIIEMTKTVSTTSTRGDVPMHEYVMLRGYKDGNKYTWTLLRDERLASVQNYIRTEYKDIDGWEYTRDRSKFYKDVAKFENAIKNIVNKYDDVTASTPFA